MRMPPAWERCQNVELDVKGKQPHVPIKSIVGGWFVSENEIYIYIVTKLQLPTSRGVNFRVPSSRGNQHIMEEKNLTS